MCCRSEFISLFLGFVICKIRKENIITNLGFGVILYLVSIAEELVDRESSVYV